MREARSVDEGCSVEMLAKLRHGSDEGPGRALDARHCQRVSTY